MYICPGCSPAEELKSRPMFALEANSAHALNYHGRHNLRMR